MTGGGRGKSRRPANGVPVHCSLPRSTGLLGPRILVGLSTGKEGPWWHCVRLIPSCWFVWSPCTHTAIHGMSCHKRRLAAGSTEAATHGIAPVKLAPFLSNDLAISALLHALCRYRKRITLRADPDAAARMPHVVHSEQGAGGRGQQCHWGGAAVAKPKSLSLKWESLAKIGPGLVRCVPGLPVLACTRRPSVRKTHEPWRQHVVRAPRRSPHSPLVPPVSSLAFSGGGAVVCMHQGCACRPPTIARLLNCSYVVLLYLLTSSRHCFMRPHGGGAL